MGSGFRIVNHSVAKWRLQMKQTKVQKLTQLVEVSQEYKQSIKPGV